MEVIDLNKEEWKLKIIELHYYEYILNKKIRNKKVDTKEALRISRKIDNLWEDVFESSPYSKRFKEAYNKNFRNRT